MWTSRLGPGILCELSRDRWSSCTASLENGSAVLCSSKIQWKAVLVLEKGGLEMFCGFVPAGGICNLLEKSDECWAEAPWAAPGGSCCWVCSVSGSAVLLSWDKWVTNPPCGLVFFSVTGSKRGFSYQVPGAHSSCFFQWFRGCYFILHRFFVEKKKWFPLLCL